MNGYISLSIDQAGEKMREKILKTCIQAGFTVIEILPGNLDQNPKSKAAEIACKLPAAIGETGKARPSGLNQMALPLNQVTKLSRSQFQRIEIVTVLLVTPPRANVSE
ncbi:MAG: hypothetical protein AB7H86_00580 [Blastocatellales bacterium]